MKEIPLTKGKIAIVDDADFEWLNQWKWFYHESHSSAYAARTVYLGGGRNSPHRYKTVRMHNVIMNPPEGLVVDHINRDSLDYQRRNLRIVTCGQNTCNRAKPRVGSSQYKGVFKQERFGKKVHSIKWGAKISINGKQVAFAFFDKEYHAAMAYDWAAELLQGECAFTNFKRFDLLERIAQDSP